MSAARNETPAFCRLSSYERRAGQEHGRRGGPDDVPDEDIPLPGRGLEGGTSAFGPLALAYA